jgi:hypothetical protein
MGTQQSLHLSSTPNANTNANGPLKVVFTIGNTCVDDDGKATIFVRAEEGKYAAEYLRSVTFTIPEIVVKRRGMDDQPWEKTVDSSPFCVSRTFKQMGFLSKHLIASYSCVVRLKFHRCFAQNAVKAKGFKLFLGSNWQRQLVVPMHALLLTDLKSVVRSAIGESSGVANGCKALGAGAPLPYRDAEFSAVFDKVKSYFPPLHLPAGAMTAAQQVGHTTDLGSSSRTSLVAGQNCIQWCRASELLACMGRLSPYQPPGETACNLEQETRKAKQTKIKKTLSAFLQAERHLFGVVVIYMSFGSSMCVPNTSLLSGIAARIVTL